MDLSSLFGVGDQPSQGVVKDLREAASLGFDMVVSTAGDAYGHAKHLVGETARAHWSQVPSSDQALEYIGFGLELGIGVTLAAYDTGKEMVTDTARRVLPPIRARVVGAAREHLPHVPGYAACETFYELLTRNLSVTRN